jgi:hypothetical protein
VSEEFARKSSPVSQRCRPDYMPGRLSHVGQHRVGQLFFITTEEVVGAIDDLDLGAGAQLLR